MTTTAETARAALAPLIAKAAAERKWLWCRYQDLWFSPAQLTAQNASGKFLWSPENWQLRDPSERIKNAEDDVANAQRELERIKADVIAASQQMETP